MGVWSSSEESEESEEEVLEAESSEEEEGEDLTPADMQEWVTMTVLPVLGMLGGIGGLNFIGDMALGSGKGWPFSLLAGVVIFFLYAYLGVWEGWGCDCCSGMVRQPPAPEEMSLEERELQTAEKIVAQYKMTNPMLDVDVDDD